MKPEETKWDTRWKICSNVLWQQDISLYVFALIAHSSPELWEPTDPKQSVVKKCNSAPQTSKTTQWFLWQISQNLEPFLDYINTKHCAAAPSVTSKLSLQDYLTEMWYPRIFCHCCVNISETKFKKPDFLLDHEAFFLVHQVEFRKGFRNPKCCCHPPLILIILLVSLFLSFSAPSSSSQGLPYYPLIYDDDIFQVTATVPVPVLGWLGRPVARTN